ncbi:hypothetical protein LIER_07803 [Lithospermum erythrorhizon]|uniref:Reverse transcriptase zinc-binding domain-containing protein n=1 Tax=Lithospermum erythrorhizon TaxID=34254 RepID=A0AAV3PAP4_LITER
MLEGREVLRKGIRWRMGDGKGIDIWKDPWLVNSVMDNDDANLVLAIPLSRQQIRDRLVWNHTKSGNYLTSLGYLSVRNMKRIGELGGSCEGDTSMGMRSDKIWQSIWGLKVPPRVRNFLWKWLHNVLPTKVNLRPRGVKIEDCCPLCNSAPETAEHVFLYCPVTARFWYMTHW